MLRRRWRRRRRPYAFGRLLAAGWLVVTTIALAFFYFEFSLRPTIRQFVEAQVNWRATEILQQSVLSTFGPRVDYQELVYLERDRDNRIVFMQANVVQINRLAAEATLSAQRAMEKLRDEKMSIPLGQALGSELLANYGPPVSLSFLPVGTVKVRLQDSFDAAGINQTRHRIYLEVEGDVRAVVPLVGEKVRVQTQVPIADAVIVGPVPTTYLKFSYPGG